MGLPVLRAVAVAATVFSVSLFTAPSGARAESMPASRAEISLSFAPVVREAAPAVVNVFAQKMVRERRDSPFAGDPFFERFFGDDSFGMPRQRVENSLGSGVIVRFDGVVITNNHVIEGAQELKVVLADRREYDATILLQDTRTDLAVLKIDPGSERLPVLELGDSDAAEVGDLVLAIGNPFGVGQTVTSGIVSAVARTQVGVADFRFFIQTDAAINPGNSGGALIGLDGRLLGINTAIYSRGGGSNGIGFAIPANMVRRVIDGAVSGGRVVRPWIGASTQNVTNDLAQSLGLARPGGVILTTLFDGGPAARAGLEVGDVIESIDGHEIGDSEALRFRIATLSPDTTATVEYLREGRRRSVSIKLTAPPEDPPREETVLAARSPLTGATVANLSPALADELGLDLTMTGVVIVAVPRDSLAARFQFRGGDIIKSINGEVVSRSRDLPRLLAGGRAFDILIRRGNDDFRLSFQN